MGVVYIRNDKGEGLIPSGIFYLSALYKPHGKGSSLFPAELFTCQL